MFQQNHRIDCIPCIKLNPVDRRSRMSRMSIQRDETINDPLLSVQQVGILRIFFERYYVPFIFHPIIKVIIVSAIPLGKKKNSNLF